MPGAGSPPGLRQRIDAAWPGLTPAERQVAQFAAEHADDLAGFSGAEVAELAGASKATVSRFFRRLGYASYAQARAQARTDARALRARGVPTGGLPAGGTGPVDVHVAHDVDNLTRTAAHLAAEDLPAVVDLLAGARRVLVLGWRNSHPVALHLREQLLQARADVSVGPAPGQTVAEELTGLDGRDALVVVAFRRRTPDAAAVLRVAADLGVPCLLLTDPAAGPPPVPVAHRLVVPVEGPGAFDSYAAVMTTVAVLAEGVLARRGRAGRDRVRDVARAHRTLGELEEL
ncbi:SIS domain-containing protein [Kineococcus aurantiacus]|uniref:DNA-binding MurR/RpiR family transcriptional regulator n=1 Tax=Kineococcus aurantiacus TaxID=37633 RepID=A0A7Y9DPM7_9ACTN|nr:DNA-binding MurR/RpiR family transcriptional regulator [Kineococcus aurantiacus]